MTCVDFLEDVGGDFFKIPSDIRAIYDSLGDGVAIIAIQKKTDGFDNIKLTSKTGF